MSADDADQSRAGLPEEGGPPPEHDVTRDALERAVLRERVRSRMSAGDAEAPAIGRYSVLRVLGEGAMGTVYAVFDDQLDRRIALKLIKGSDSTEARKRMLREAQAMAKLSHPNVVPVFEVGEHEGQLFVAMEYVGGVTLGRWRQQEQRPWWEVLDKYLQAGRGLAAAHAEGLVHRDFKPSNAVVGSDGRVRVLDFGLAAKHGDKQAEAALSVVLPVAKDPALDTPLTQTGTVMGTPAYMPPEQFMSHEVDQRSDQFSFCVALWEALYDKRPFAGENTVELFTAVAEGELSEPPRNEVPAALRPLLERGLKPSPAQRWPSLPDLLAELERLNVDPTRARRTRRTLAGVGFGGVAVVGGILVARAWIDARQTDECQGEASRAIDAIWNSDARTEVHDGLVATQVSYAETTADKVLPKLDQYAATWQKSHAATCIDARVAKTRSDADLDRAQWCLDERSMALAALVEQLRDADEKAVNDAVRAAANLPRVDGCRDADLLKQLPAPPDPGVRAAVREARARHSSAAALNAIGKYAAGLEVARAVVEQSTALQRPSLHASALTTVGSSLSGLGKYEEAKDVLADSYFEAQDIQAYDIASSAATRLVLVTGVRLGRHDNGFVWARHAKVALDHLDVGPDHPHVAARLNNLANVHYAAGEYAQAEALHERVLAIHERSVGSDHPDVATSLSNLAITHRATGEYAEAKVLTERALAHRKEAFGPDHPKVGDSLSNLGNVHFHMGEYARAKGLHERALAIRKKALGADHPDLANSLSNLANAHYAAGENAQAKALHERALAILNRAVGPDHPRVANTLQNLALVHHAAGELEDARALNERVLAIHDRTLSPEHPNVAASLHNLASVHRDLGEHDRARSLYERALAIQEQVLGPDHPDLAIVLHSLAAIDEAAGNHAKARASYERALAIREAALGPDHPHVAASLSDLGSVSATIGDDVRARALYERALTIFDAHDGVQSQELSARTGFAKLLVRMGGDRPRAIAEADKAAQGYRAAGPNAATELADVEALLRRVSHEAQDATE